MILKLEDTNGHQHYHHKILNINGFLYYPLNDLTPYMVNNIKIHFL